MSKLALTALLATSLGCGLLTPLTAQAPKPVKPAPTTNNDPNPVVGMVGDSKVTWEQVIARMMAENKDGLTQSIATIVGQEASKAFFANPPKAEVTISRALAFKVLREQPTQQVTVTLDTMLDEEAMRQEMLKMNLRVGDQDVQDFLKKVLGFMRTKGQIPANVTDEQFLAQQGMTKESALRTMRPRVMAGALWLKDFEQSTLGHALSPDDFVQARHILVRGKSSAPNTKPEEIKKLEQENLEKIKKIAEEIKTGKKTFEAAAAEYGEDGTKAEGGSLGVFGRSTMVKEFDAVAFALKPGVVSEPIKTQFGYHLIRVDKTGKELTPAQRDEALEMLKNRGVSGYIPKLRKNAKVQNLLRSANPGVTGE